MSEFTRFHPELERNARRYPRWLPDLGTRRGLRFWRALTGLARAVPGTGATLESTPYGNLLRPAGGSGTAAPAMLWIHGGGLVLGRPELETAIASMFVRELGISVLACRYRLAPEHVYPAALDDCFQALSWLADQPFTDRERVLVGGASAGGGLAAAVALRNRERRLLELRGQLLVSPMLDDRTALRSVGRAGRPIVWTPGSNRFGWTSYLGTEPGGPEVPAQAAPARERDLAGLPPTWLGVGTADLFHDEDVDYATRLRAAGVDCDLHVVDGAFHGFDAMVPKAPVSIDWRRRQVAWAASLIG